MADKATSKKTVCELGNFKPITAIVGTAFVASLAAASFANADSPFAAQVLDNGYDQLAKAEGEGKCGEGKCGEGKCGENASDEAADGEAATAEAATDDTKADAEGKCGEGKCGESKADSEGKCGGAG